MYEVFLLLVNGTVSLQLVINVSRWIVLSHCIYRVSHCSLSVYLNIAGLSPIETFWGSWKILEFFVSKRMRILYYTLTTVVITDIVYVSSLSLLPS